MHIWCTSHHWQKNGLYMGSNSQWQSMIIYLLLIDINNYSKQMIYWSIVQTVIQCVDWSVDDFLTFTEAITWDHLSLSGCLSNSLNNCLSKKPKSCSNHWTKVAIHLYKRKCWFLPHLCVGCFVALAMQIWAAQHLLLLATLHALNLIYFLHKNVCKKHTKRRNGFKLFLCW